MYGKPLMKQGLVILCPKVVTVRMYHLGCAIIAHLEPDVAAAYPTEEVLNEALQFVLKKKNKEK